MTHSGSAVCIAAVHHLTLPEVLGRREMRSLPVSFLHLAQTLAARLINSRPPRNNANKNDKPDLPTSSQTHWKSDYRPFSKGV